MSTSHLVDGEWNFEVRALRFPWVPQYFQVSENFIALERRKRPIRHRFYNRAAAISRLHTRPRTKRESLHNECNNFLKKGCIRHRQEVYRSIFHREQKFYPWYPPVSTLFIFHEYVCNQVWSLITLRPA